MEKTLDLNSDNVIETELSMTDVRAWLDGDENEDLSSAMDEAQGQIHMGKTKIAFVVIKITE